MSLLTKFSVCSGGKTCHAKDEKLTSFISIPTLYTYRIHIFVSMFLCATVSIELENFVLCVFA